MSMLSDQQMEILKTINELGCAVGSHILRLEVARAGALTIRFQHDIADLMRRGLLECDLNGLTITRAGVKALAA